MDDERSKRKKTNLRPIVSMEDHIRDKDGGVFLSVKPTQYINTRFNINYANLIRTSKQGYSDKKIGTDIRAHKYYYRFNKILKKCVSKAKQFGLLSVFVRLLCNLQD